MHHQPIPKCTKIRNGEKDNTPKNDGARKTIYTNLILSSNITRYLGTMSLYNILH